ncbi:MAG: CpaE family protein [Novosphingobium sp.]|jgi:pilus assembly protein CpaE|uniref:AAA family ATPase n=1 Tax=Novosphingobium sp. TaxID=1874826 RepID=UPI00391D6E12
MGHHDHIFDQSEEHTLRFPERLVIAASPERLVDLRAQASAALLAGVDQVPLHDSPDLDDQRLASASLVVLEVEPSNPTSLNRLTKLREKRPDLPVIAALSSPTLSVVQAIVRHGVADVVALPFVVTELVQACVNAAVNQGRAVSAPTTLAPLIAVVRATGGSGATTIATHLAGELAANSLHGCCLIDLDIQNGTVADYLAIRPRRTIADLLEAEDRVDRELLLSAVTTHQSGLKVIAAPEDIIPLETINPDQLLRILELARREYDWVVLDLPSNWTSWNLSTVLAASKVLMVVEMNIPSLRQAKRRLQLFASVGVRPDAVEVVVNRMEKRLFKTISLSDVEASLGCAVLSSIHAEGDAVSAAQDQGLLTGQVARRSRFNSDIVKLATDLKTSFGGHG